MPNDIIKQIQQWRLLDVTLKPIVDEVNLPFAVEEWECEQVAAGERPLLHIWRHQKALVLGLRDRKLQGAATAMRTFREDGWSVTVRSSGGAAVPLDEGVVNVSLILPNSPGTVNIHHDFALMASVVADAVNLLGASTQVRAGEILGAYCPGDYDLSIDGFKFCGIAQRRRLGAYSVQAFVVVEGVGADKAEAAARFYRMAGNGVDSPNVLQVTERSTRSLRELMGPEVTVERFVEAVRTVVLGKNKEKTGEKNTDYDGYDPLRLKSIAETMKKRYDTN